jgi:hypothetical protein
LPDTLDTRLTELLEEQMARKSRLPLEMAIQDAMICLPRRQRASKPIGMLRALNR